MRTLRFLLIARAGRLTRIGGAESFAQLEDRLRAVRADARAVFERRVLS